MIRLAETPSPQPGPARLEGLKELLSRDGWALLAVAAATILVELGTFSLALWSGAAFRESMIAALAVTSLWVALAPAPLAAGGRNNISAVLRGGVVADASAVSLVVLWAIGLAAGEACSISFLGAVKVYCVCASLALAGVAVVCLGTSQAGRSALAVTVAVAFAMALASPLWISAWIGDSPSAADTPLATWALRINPFYAAADAVVERTGFVWHTWGWMYDSTRIGQYAQPRCVGWYETCLLYLGLATLAAAGAITKHQHRRRHKMHRGEKT